MKTVRVLLAVVALILTTAGVSEARPHKTPTGYNIMYSGFKLSPCSTLTWSVNIEQYPGTGADIADAMKAFSAAIHIPVKRVPWGTKARVRFIWANEEQYNEALDGPTIGQAHLALNNRWATGGYILLDRTYAEAPYRLHDTWGMIYRHEMGHLAGLGHVDDEGQIMFSGSPQTEYQSGDLAGLKIRTPNKGNC